MSKKVIIIGAGLGGLATALRLSCKGYEVTVIEKYHQPGGRLNQLQKDGFTFDVGPSFFSMSYEFDELFASCNTPNPLTLQELNPVYSVYFEGREKPFLIHKDLKKLAEEFAGLENNFEEKITKYLKVAGKLFHDTENIVIRRNFKNKLDYLFQLTKVPVKHAPKMFRSMWKELENTFDSQEVKVIFSLVAFFLGDTPFKTPAVYTLLNYTELIHDGYWTVKGSMYEIVEQLMKLLKEKGVKFYFNTEIVEVGNSKPETRNPKQFVSHVIDKNGNEFTADIFVANSDAASFRGKILKREKFNEQKLDAMDWTLAPFTIYLGVKGKLQNIHHHNYFLGTNFNEYADTIFKTSLSPKKPYYYVNVSSQLNENCAPEGCENLFILCPVPDLRQKPDWSDTEDLANNIISDLSKRINFDLHSNTITKTIWNPVDWQDKFNLYRGSGLGLAHGLNQIGGFRPSNKDEELSNLYYVGASTVPGTGLPIVVIGSKLVCERIEKEN